MKFRTNLNKPVGMKVAFFIRVLYRIKLAERGEVTSLSKIVYVKALTLRVNFFFVCLPNGKYFPSRIYRSEKNSEGTEAHYVYKFIYIKKNVKAHSHEP